MSGAPLDGYFDVISPFACLQWRLLRRDHPEVVLNPKSVLLPALRLCIGEQALKLGVRR